MPKVVKATPSNPTAAASKSGIKAAVWSAPTGSDIVGTVRKQFQNQSFDAAGTLTLDVDDVGALNAGDAVVVFAQSATEAFSGLLDCVVSSTASSLDPAVATTDGVDNSIELTLPGGTAASGDRIIIVVAIYDSGKTRTLAAPTQQGTWNTLVDDGYGGKNGRLYVYDRELNATITSLTALTATGTAGQWLAAVIKARGARTQPVAVQSAEFAAAFVAPGINATVADSTLLRVAFSKNWPRYFTSPGTELFDIRGASYIGMAGSWSRVQAGYQNAASFIPSDTAGGAPSGDDYTAVSIVLDGTGGAVTPPPPTGAQFFFGAHQHGRSHTSGASGINIYERYSGGSAFSFSVIRSHNAEPLQFDGQHMGWWAGRAGGINLYAWEKFDAWCQYHKDRGRRLLWNVFGNPTWIARNTTTDAYGFPGGCSYVTQANRPAYRQFVADTVAHILSTFGADFLVGVEAWNEPIGGESGDNSQFLKASGYDNTQGLSSIQQCIADITKDVYLGVRSVTSTVPVIGFAHAWWGSPIDKIIASKTSEGEPIWQFCDIFSFHPYGFSDQWDSSNANGRSLSTLKADILSKLPASQRSKPLWATECAMPELWNGSIASTVWWTGEYAASKDALATKQYNWVAEFKNGGWGAVFVYSVDGGWTNTGNGTSWAGGDHSSGYNFLGLSSTSMSGALNTQIAAAWTLANTNLHSWG
jgi:hypothetical protein